MRSKKPKPRTPLLSALYGQYLDSRDAAGFVRKLSKRYTPGALERLACHHAREVRRAAICSLGFIGDYSANHTMGRALLDDDRTVRLLAESGIRSVWTRVGNKPQQREIDAVIRLNNAGESQRAIRRASVLIDRVPWFAEAWNQRAVARFHLKQFAESIRDCHEALEINPYHYIAATTMGRSYLELHNNGASLESFRRALRLNPNLEGVRVQVVRLTRTVEDK